MKPRYVFAGDRNIAVSVLQFLLAQDAQPLALIVPDAGTGTHGTDLIDMCPFLGPDQILFGNNFCEPQGQALLQALNLDYVISIHFASIFPTSVLEIPRLGVLNLHPAYLPYTRGWHTPSWAILDQSKYGATLHFMDSGINTGDIIHQKEIQVFDGDTANAIYSRVKSTELEVFQEAWPDLVDGTFTRTPQPTENGIVHKRKDLFCKEVQYLDLDEVVETGELLRRLRGLTTNCIEEAAYFEINGRRYRVQIEIDEQELDISSNNDPQVGATEANQSIPLPETLEEAETAANSKERAVDNPSRIFLSPPHMSPRERELLLDAFDSNWIAPLGPHVDAFEKEFAEKVGTNEAVALSSGTAALHLSLLMLGVEKGDEVFTSSLTFAATANAIAYVGAHPVFIDSDSATWNMDPDLLSEELEASAKRGKLPKAVIAVDLYGQCADYDQILKICQFYDVPLVEDAAEALGATYRGKSAGTFGSFGVFSFNGNKIITTSGGGMLVTDDKDLAEKARFLATQARDPAPHYQHSEIGYNYRMSNLLAAIGRGQLSMLETRVDQRRANFEYYRDALADLPGIRFMPEISGGRSTRWLTCMVIDPDEFGATTEDVRLAHERHNIESRPLWKPMHLQPVFANCRNAGARWPNNYSTVGFVCPAARASPTVIETELSRLFAPPASHGRRASPWKVNQAID